MAKKSTPEFDWTVMVYLAGDNNLTEESVFSLTEMEGVETDGIAVIAQFDPKSSRIPSHRYVIKGAPTPRTSTGRARPVSGGLGTHAKTIEEPTIKFSPRPGHKAQRPKRKDGETDTGDPATLFDFISWTQEKYRAKRYMVILAGHGAGTEDDFLLKDENPANSSLSIPDLREVFAQAKRKLKIKVDILGMDVCLMSMVEVCYELRGVVEYLVGSESFSPAAGWPYGQILTELQKKKEAKTEDIASTMVGEYIGFYSDYVMGGLSVDQSVLKVSASSPVVTAVKNFTKAMQGRLKRRAFQDAIILAHWESQSYNGELFVDLQDFCELLAARDPRAARACRKVIEAIDGALVRKSGFTGVENQFSKGVSIYFPWSDVEPSYKDLAFAKRSGWNDFLREYVRQTRRKQRGFKQGSKSEPLLSFVDRPRNSASAALESERFRKSGDRKSGDRGVNPIHSMRNPPITVVKEGLSECIRANPDLVKRLEAFSRIRPLKTRR